MDNENASLVCFLASASLSVSTRSSSLSYSSAGLKECLKDNVFSCSSSSSRDSLNPATAAAVQKKASRDQKGGRFASQREFGFQKTFFGQELSFRSPFTASRSTDSSAETPRHNVPMAVMEGESDVSQEEIYFRAPTGSLWSMIADLKTAMDNAVEIEDYKEAARIRDALKELEVRLEVKEPDRSLNISSGNSEFFSLFSALQSASVLERNSAVDRLSEIGDEKAVAPLVGALQDVDPDVRAKAEKALWRIFHRYGMDEVDNRLQEGVLAMQKGQLTEAVNIFGDVIRLAPDFAEGYNKRATAYYLLRNFDQSILDCEETVRLQPYHFGAWSGMGLCHVGQKRFEKAVECFQRAVDINPNMIQVKQYLIAVKVMLANRSKDK